MMHTFILHNQSTDKNVDSRERPVDWIDRFTKKIGMVWDFLPNNLRTVLFRKICTSTQLLGNALKSFLDLALASRESRKILLSQDDDTLHTTNLVQAWYHSQSYKESL